MRLVGHSRRFVPLVLAVACVGLATALPTWRIALAQLSGYSILGCETESGSGELIVTLSQGSVVTTEFRCMDGLNDLATVCSILQQGQFYTHQRGFSTLYTFECP
jgi:hypothetical protein